MSSPSEQPHDTSKCPCGTCHKARVENGTQDDYERELRVATNKVLDRLKGSEEDNKAPLCHRCNKTRAWRGECIECYMVNHSESWVDAHGRRHYPDTHNIRQGYYMEEEHYARGHRVDRERHTEAKALVTAASKAGAASAAAAAMPGGETESGFLKNLFQTLQGVKYDGICPHGEPFYACMSCSH